MKVTLVKCSQRPEGDSMKKLSVYEWHKRFKEGRESVENDERRDRSSSHRTDEDAEKVRTLFHSDRRLSMRATTVN